MTRDPSGPVRLGADTRLPLLGVRVGDVPERVVVVGDPARAEQAAGLLESAKELGRSREYVTFVGTRRGQPVGVVSHGVGGPGAAVCFEELCRADVRTVIRAGTAGGVQPDVQAGHFVVATAAIREDGYSDGVVPPAFPASGDHRVVAALRARLEREGRPVHTGIVLTSGVFYAHAVVEDALTRWRRAGAVAVEMEVAALYVIAALHGIRAGAVLTVDGNPVESDDAAMRTYDPRRRVTTEAVERMLVVALDVVASV